MSPFIVLIVVLLAALLVCFLLWRRESRAAGAPLSITGLAIPLLVVAVAGLGYLTIGLAATPWTGWPISAATTRWPSA